jgi:RNA polymerase sigma factor (sigma-70 family)
VTRQINKEGRLSDFPSEVRHLWHTRHDEPLQQVFDRLPGWMEEDHLDVDWGMDVVLVLRMMFTKLKYREREVLWYRFWEDFTLEECGELYGITRESARKIQENAIRKLKHPVLRHHLFDFFDYPTERELEQRHSG